MFPSHIVRIKSSSKKRFRRMTGCNEVAFGSVSAALFKSGRPSSLILFVPGSRVWH